MMRLHNLMPADFSNQVDENEYAGSCRISNVASAEWLILRTLQPKTFAHQSLDCKVKLLASL